MKFQLLKVHLSCIQSLSLLELWSPVQTVISLGAVNPLVASSFDFLCNSFSWLLAGNVCSMVHGVLFEALAETAGRSTGVRLRSGRFVVNLTGTCGWCHCCARIVWRCLMSRLFRLSRLSLFSLIIQYESGEVSFESMYLVSTHLSYHRWYHRLIRKINVLVMLQGFQMCWTLVNEVCLLLIHQWSWLYGHAETGVDWSSVEQIRRWQ